MNNLILRISAVTLSLILIDSQLVVLAHDAAADTGGEVKANGITKLSDCTKSKKEAQVMSSHFWTTSLLLLGALLSTLAFWPAYFSKSQGTVVTRSTKSEWDSSPAVAGIADAFDYPISNVSRPTRAIGDSDGWHVINDFGNNLSSAPCSAHYHPGDDWNKDNGQDAGEPVKAVANGVVESIRTLTNTTGAALGQGIGVSHVLLDGSTRYSVYVHVNVDSSMFVGKVVTKGDPIATVYNLSFGPHLHFEMRSSFIATDWYPGDDGCGYYDTYDAIISHGFIDPVEFIDSHRSLSCSFSLGQGTSESELTAFQDASSNAGGQGVLGCPTNPVQFNGFTSFVGTMGHFQTFTNGAIEYLSNGSRAGQAHAVVNPLYNKWSSFGFSVSNPLGYPIGNLSSQSTSCFGTNLKFQQFEGGALEHHLSGPRVGSVYEVHGAIYTKWAQKGFAGCPLGLPIGDERAAQPSAVTGRTGRVSDFEGGHIHWWTGAPQAFETHGVIDSLYVSMGGTASWLGFPTSDVYVASTGYERSDFEGGYITTTDGAVFQASSRWITNGPSVTSLEMVTSLAIDPSNPNIIYAGIGSFLHGFPAAGVFKSIDGGKIWSAVNAGLGNADVGALAIDPVNPSTIYAGTYVHGGSEIGGVFKSTNGGNSWTPMNTGLQDSLNVNALTIDPSSPATIYAGTSPFSFSGGGVYKSTNGAGTWNRVNTGITAHYIAAVAIDPATPTTVYAGSNTLGGGMFKSIDGGSNWTSIANGLTQNYVNAIAIDPATPTTIYLGTQFSGGVYKSTNGGLSWSQANTGLAPITSHIEALAIDPSRPSTIYAGTSSQLIFRSTNGGGNWIPFSDGLPANTDVRSLVVDHSGIYLHAGTNLGVYDLQFGTTSTLQFTAATYSVSEGAGAVSVSVSRSGNTSGASTFNYTTSDTAGLNNCNVFSGIASSRCDYAASVHTVRFDAGQTSKTISIPIIDDSYAEEDESFTITLSNATGDSLGYPGSATVTINDNEVTDGPNPIDATPFFVREQYLDFLNREPDPPGFAAWQAVINNCSPGDTTCDRIHVSSAFFRSPEFQDRGYFVYRFYSVSYGRKPDYAEFIPDLARVSGFLSPDELEAAKIAFINDFMARPAFATYNGLSNTQYVDTLLATAGVTSPNRDFWIAALGNGTRTRATVLREISESTEIYHKYFNQAFVVMQYFGYLRRDPDALYTNWIQVLDTTNDFRGMVSGFMNSLEYRFRFGP